MIVMRRNLDFEQTVVLLETLDDSGVVVLRCCGDKGRYCFRPRGRMKR